MLKRCGKCGGTVVITRMMDEHKRMCFVIIGHGMMPCRCGKAVKMRSAVCNTLASADDEYDLLCKRWNEERGLPDDRTD